MKQYLLSIYQPDGPAPPKAFLDEVMRDVNALNQEMRPAGAWVFTAGCTADTATVVAQRASEGDVLMTDGPFAEGKEHIGGFIDHPRAGSRRCARVGQQAGARAQAAVDRGAAVPGRARTEHAVRHRRRAIRCRRSSVSSARRRPRGGGARSRLRRHRDCRGGRPGRVRPAVERWPSGRAAARVRPDGSSRPRAIARSIVSAARRGATTGTRRRPLHARAAGRARRTRRTPCATIACA